MEELRKEVARLKGHLVTQGEELLRLKKATVSKADFIGLIVMVVGGYYKWVKQKTVTWHPLRLFSG